MINKYILQGNCKNLALSLLVAIIVMVPGALALPQYLTSLNTLYGPGLSCDTCHINPAGGGPRTAYGMLFENQTNHMTDPTAALTTIGSPTATPTPTPTAGTTASRTIENGILTAGSTTNITVVILNDATQAISMQETIPSGWILTRVTDNADQFRASTNEWVWLTVTGGVTETVTYMVTVPSGTTPGIYNISGTISTANANIAVSGGNTIEVTAVPVVSARRTIDNPSLMAGSATGVTVSIQNGVTHATALKEIIPFGWVLTQVTDDANQFKANTNEWIWFSVAGGTTTTVKYKLTVPPGTKPGTYSINGTVATSGSIADITGDNTISVTAGDMLSYYRGLGINPNIVETNDLLKASDDWRNDIIPPGFSVSITTDQLLVLADEWRGS